MIEGIRERLSDIDIPYDKKSEVEDVVAEEIGFAVAILREMIDYWESSVGDDDKSFYTLGIRRAIDVLEGVPAISHLPILETDDTPDE